MKKKTTERIAATLVGVGILGAVCCAESMEYGIGTFVACELPCLAVALIGAKIGNKAAETEAPAANTMKGGQTANS